MPSVGLEQRREGGVTLIYKIILFFKICKHWDITTIQIYGISLK